MVYFKKFTDALLCRSLQQDLRFVDLTLWDFSYHRAVLGRLGGPRLRLVYESAKILQKVRFILQRSIVRVSINMQVSICVRAARNKARTEAALGSILPTNRLWNT